MKTGNFLYISCLIQTWLFDYVNIYILKIVKLTESREKPWNWIQIETDEPKASSLAPGCLLTSVFELLTVSM